MNLLRGIREKLLGFETNGCDRHIFTYSHVERPLPKANFIATPCRPLFLNPYQIKTRQPTVVILKTQMARCKARSCERTSLTMSQTLTWIYLFDCHMEVTNRFNRNIVLDALWNDTRQLKDGGLIEVLFQISSQ